MNSNKISIVYLLVLCLILLMTLVVIGEDNIQPSSKSKPPFKLNIPMNEDNAVNELADAIQYRFETEIKQNPEMDNLPEEMVQFNAQVFQVSEKPEKILEEAELPFGTEKKVEYRDTGGLILELIDNIGFELSEKWGEGWLEKAEQKAEEHAGKEIAYWNSKMDNSPMDSYTVTIMSPYIDPYTLEFYEGTYVSITHFQINMNMNMEEMMDMAEEYGGEDDGDYDF